jgi:hypothetical protein
LRVEEGNAGLFKSVPKPITDNTQVEVTEVEFAAMWGDDSYTETVYSVEDKSLALAA